MRRDDPYLPHLRRIVEALGDLREQVVFVGGAVAGLLVTDPLANVFASEKSSALQTFRPPSSSP